MKPSFSHERMNEYYVASIYTYRLSPFMLAYNDYCKKNRPEGSDTYLYKKVSKPWLHIQNVLYTHFDVWIQLNCKCIKIQGQSCKGNDSLLNRSRMSMSIRRCSKFLHDRRHDRLLRFLRRRRRRWLWRFLSTIRNGKREDESVSVPILLHLFFDPEMFISVRTVFN